MPVLRPFWILTLILALPQVCAAGTGMSNSVSTLIDTTDPVINLDQLPENFLVHAGQPLDFHWTSGDDNPGAAPDDFVAIIKIGPQPSDSISWFPDIEEFTWTWIPPEIQNANYRLEVTARDVMGNTKVVVSDYFTVLLSTTPVPDVPTVINFQAPYPNPFNPSCEMAFTLPTAENVELSVYDARGRKIRELVRGSMAAGTTRIRWDGTDQRGHSQSGGLYFFVLKTTGPDGPVKMVRKATLIP